ncbi:glycoside hydrolase [Enterovirga rhinocerotis]|uniref:NlpC/P60 family protein n=1 Tax=Enterovirga rhinocerotis TaxID=1339210 RepID=A0A4R7BZT4_9HYPH|nr:glycoside hydrolase [Enterovirga rhinocerotis]TDR90285.1 hypothetical protein EV668_3131 [Enterovirga rhinocerotis]
MVTIRSGSGRVELDLDAGTISFWRSRIALDRSAYVEGLLGRPYDAQRANCWQLVVDVQRDLFGRILPGGNEPLPEDRAAALQQGVEVLGWHEHPTPQDGDVVMMSRFAGGPHDHVGTFLADRRGVLHTDTWHGVVCDDLASLRHVRLWRPRFYRPDA